MAATTIRRRAGVKFQWLKRNAYRGAGEIAIEGVDPVEGKTVDFSQKSNCCVDDPGAGV